MKKTVQVKDYEVEIEIDLEELAKYLLPRALDKDGSTSICNGAVQVQVLNPASK